MTTTDQTRNQSKPVQIAETISPIAAAGPDPVGPVNQWVPTSPCGRHCVPATTEVSTFRRIVRTSAALIVMLTVLVVGLLAFLLPRRARHGYWRVGARIGLRVMGVRLEVTDHRPPHARRVRGALVVANHVSFLDIIAIASVAPARFVAKREVLSMGCFGPVARLFGVLPHVRGDLRALTPMLERVTRILDRGRAVAVFPEGTTWCGAASGRFRPAFFQSAVDAGVPVLPIQVSYSASGRPTTLAGLIGEDTIATTFRRIIAAPDLRISLTVFDLQLPTPNRRELATGAQRLVLPATDLSDRVEMVALPRSAASGTAVRDALTN
ncbi:lysophospholipid acyltransferase family protein [Gordonia zhaorongruii]|uniref:lysophospholipid acyltransferase family protein n=1 Tax=Gordonia zhaorongruii TaxID=2597659 RepID=UPI00104DBF03|nr:lysophospholipid acyltransferase family protein [Gordonia zhaorongruii]